MIEKNKNYFGYWWLPNGEENKISGTLTLFEGGKYILKTLNRFHELSKESYLTELIELDLILGFAVESSTNDTFSFKLIDSLKSNIILSSLSSIEFSVSKVLKSQFKEFSFDLKFDTLKIRPTCIDNWFNKMGYKLTYPEDRKKGLNNFQLNYFQLEDEILFECNEFKITSSFEVSYNFPKNEFKTKQLANLVVEYNSKRDLVKILEDSLKIRNFFTLAVGEPVHYESFFLASTFIKKGSKHRTYFSYHANNKFDNIKIDYDFPHSDSMLFGFEHIKDDIQFIFKNWFEKYDLLKFILNNYFGTLYNQFLYSEDRFLNYIFALEVYHKTKYVKKKKLIDRISQLLNENSNLLVGLVNDQDKLANQIVETRHHFVHDTVLNPQFVIKDVVKLDKLGSILEVLIQIILLKEINMPMDIIITRIKKPINNAVIFHNSHEI